MSCVWLSYKAPVHDTLLLISAPHSAVDDSHMMYKIYSSVLGIHHTVDNSNVTLSHHSSHSAKPKGKGVGGGLSSSLTARDMQPATGFYQNPMARAGQKTVKSSLTAE